MIVMKERSHPFFLKVVPAGLAFRGHDEMIITLQAAHFCAVDENMRDPLRGQLLTQGFCGGCMIGPIDQPIAAEDGVEKDAPAVVIRALIAE